ncbi:hypothetical protein FLAVO9R_110194 [Flavobacterium sp. 9R]|nr:hypothetical protein FLAVO9R_110194 [Flavobacterium sp. 9R]
MAKAPLFSIIIFSLSIKGILEITNHFLYSENETFSSSPDGSGILA